MNETECQNLIESVKWTEPGSLISLAILEFINILVIVGNCLVIAAVFCSNKLRSVTNFFIVNLAVADLLVGLAVLPFSATWEVFKVWIFGDVWCRIWLAVDVWMCTASILNLCAISLDRYVAVTRPVTYPSIMSTKKAKSLIAGIWVLSFVICFPPLVRWKDSKSDVIETTIPTTQISTTDNRGNYTLYYGIEDNDNKLDRYNITDEIINSSTYTQFSCPWKCELTNDRGYVLYSALGSFYIPMFVMLFFYWRIYRAAVRTTRAINQGFKTTKAGSKNSSTHGPSGNKNSSNSNHKEPELTLRMHRGRSPMTTSNTQSRTSNVGSILSVNSSGNFDDLHQNYNQQKLSSSTSKRATSMKIMNAPGSSILQNKRNEKVSIRVSFPSSDDILHNTNENNGNKLIGGDSTYSLLTNTTPLLSRTSDPLVTAKLSANRGLGNRFEEQRLTLRIHRGRGSTTQPIETTATTTHNSNGSTNSTTTTLGTPSPERLSKFATKKHEKIKISVSYPSNENIHESSAPSSNRKQQKHKQQQEQSVLYAVHYSSPNGKDTTTSQIFRHPKEPNVYLQVSGNKRSSSIGHLDSQDNHHDENKSPGNSPRTSKKMGKRNIKAQVKRFRMETKAAKTLAIIVGLFILCWLPFFTMYVIRAFCEDCINPLVFSILFWLGYCNSAVNPMIYALFSKDFRFAFKRIICKCFCSSQSISARTSRRGSDLSQIRIGCRTPSISPSALNHSIGDDSEPNSIMMEQRDRQGSVNFGICNKYSEPR